ncbi:MAG: radical SAM protein [Methanosarcinaceae archaeon]|nr:radical SAM protein [Methanosarcinaceae archaeon]
MKPRIIYGPILSRRLGRSLGIDVIKRTHSKKNCNFDCMYCQLGHVDQKLTGPEDVTGAVTPEEVVEGLRNYHRNVEDLDYITFSGTCEPTLNLPLGNMIRGIKTISDVPVCVITNSSLMGRKDVRDNLAEADLVVATLVSGNEETFRTINRPADGIKLADIIEGLRELARTDGPRLAIEVMFLGSSDGDNKDHSRNTTDEEIDHLVEVLRYIDPDEIEVLTISRPPADASVTPTSERRLKEIAHRFDDELGQDRVRLVLKGLRRKRSRVKHGDLLDEVYDLILRRPCTFEQVVASLDIDQQELHPIVDKLLVQKRIMQVNVDDRSYYRGM